MNKDESVLDEAHGKAQQALMQLLRKGKRGAKHGLTDLAAYPDLRGVPYGQIMRAAQALAKKGLVKSDGTSITLAEHKEEDPMSDYADFVVEMSRGGHTGRLRELGEDSPLEAPTSGFNRHSKLMSPATRQLVLKSRVTEIEAFAEDRGFDAGRVMGVAEAAMRLGKVPDLTQYGFSGDDAKAIKHFVAGEILNIAIEDLDPRKLRDALAADQFGAPADVHEEGTVSGGMGPSMQIGSAFLTRPSSITQSDGHEWAQAVKDGTPGMSRLYPVNLGPSVPHGMRIEDYTDEEDVVGEGNDLTGKTKLGKKLQGKGKAITSPAEDPPGDFDSASGGTAGSDGRQTSTAATKRVAENNAPWREGFIDEDKSRAQRKKENKARFAKLSPDQKAATQGDKPFHPEAGKSESEDRPWRNGLGEAKGKLHPSMHKHTDTPKFKAHVGDPKDEKPPFHKGKGLQNESEARPWRRPF